MSPKPPKFPENLLRLLLPPTHRDDVAQDLADAFKERVGKKGEGIRSYLWYWAQLLSPSTLHLAFLLRARAWRRGRSGGSIR